MKKYRLDLQIHSCLSPCGSLDNDPLSIVETALERHLDIIALTDHNTTDNCPAIAEVAKRLGGITVFYGTEVTSMEEAHIICLFGKLDDAIVFGKWCKSHLPPIENDVEYFGDQPIVDADNNIIGIEKAFLAGTTDLSVEAICDKTHELNGVVIASHVDRKITSIFSQLGLWPDGTGIDGYDVSRFGKPLDFEEKVTEDLKFIRSSDAHYLADIGKIYSEIELEEPTFAAFKNWLLNH